MIYFVLEDGGVDEEARGEEGGVFGHRDLAFLYNDEIR